MTKAKYEKALKDLLEESKGLEAEADVALQYANYMEENVKSAHHYPDDDDSFDEDEEANKDQLLAFVRNAQVKFKDSKLLNRFKMIENGMLNGNIRFEAIGDDVIANRPFTFKLKYTNIAGVKLTIRQYNGLDTNHQLRRDGKLILERNYLFTTNEKTRTRSEKNLP